MFGLLAFIFFVIEARNKSHIRPIWCCGATKSTEKRDQATRIFNVDGALESAEKSPLERGAESSRRGVFNPRIAFSLPLDLTIVKIYFAFVRNDNRALFSLEAFS